MAYLYKIIACLYKIIATLYKVIACLYKIITCLISSSILPTLCVRFLPLYALFN